MQDQHEGMRLQSSIRHHKGMHRFTLRGKVKVSTQWSLYCLVHNIEKIAHGAC